MELSKKVAKSSVWLFALRFVYQILFLARLVILARLLEPHDFGLMGIALLTMMTLETFSQTGFYEALIQKKTNTQEFLDSAWTVLILRGVFLAMIMFCVAPVVASFFNTPEAKPVIQVIALAVILQSLSNIGVIYFSKEMEFKKQFLYQTGGTVIGFIVSVTIAVVYRSVWALVIGMVAGRATQLILSYVIHPYRPRLSKDFKKAKELFSFGKWILGSTALVFLITQGDDVLVGKILGASMLGFYQLAYKISNTPTTEVTKLISEVSLPAYSKLQDDTDRLREAYLKILQMTAFITFPLTGLIFILSPDFTLLFLGEKWLPMVPALQALVFAGLIRSIVATTGPLFYSIGRPKIDTRWQLVRLLVLAACIYPLILSWDLVGASIAVILSIFISSLGFVYHAAKMIECPIRILLKRIFIPLVNSSGVVGIIFGMKLIFKTDIFTFMLFLFVGGGTYLIMTFIADRFFNYRMYTFVRQSISQAFAK